jgi:hypothetical protein
MIDQFLKGYFEFVFYTDSIKLQAISLELLDRAKELREHMHFRWLLQSLKSAICKRVQSLVEAGVNVE